MHFMRILGISAALSVGITLSALAQAAGSAAAVPAAPEVGQMAPDFTLPWADSSGTRAAPVKLSDLRGKVVVIAFYPKDRTGGCTAEMTKFRDEYATLFGPDVVVLPMSGDNLESHASWAKDMKLPFALVSDVGLKTAALYGSRRPNAAAASRNTFVIGKDGRIAWRVIGFNPTFEGQYTEMAAEIAKARQ
ncbi:MAG: peroxiredoxin [Candidatus Hydrogenedentales bacterium]